MKYRILASIGTLLVAIALASLAPHVQAEEPAAKPLKVGPFSFAIAAPWKQAEKARPMTQGTIELPGKEGAAGLTASFFHFGPGQGGELEGNIKRWQGMFQESPEPKTVKEEMDFGEAKAALVSITGSYIGSRFSPEPEPRTGYTLLAAVLPSKNGDVYVRLVGPEAGVTAAKEDFKKLLLTAVK
ncbi:MAG: hypothetical protein ACKV19_18400 [Verrucomicrobiales bacterium]